MKQVMRFKWLVAIFWIILVAVLAFTAPNMNDLVRENGEIKLPDGYASSIAKKLQKKHDSNKEGEQYLAVYTSNKKLTKDDFKQIEKKLTSIEQNKAQYHVTEMMTSFNQPDSKDQFIAKDGKTMIASLTIDASNKSVKKIRSDLDKKMEIKGISHYLTGNALIQEDVIQGSEDGLHKTEGITVVFILVVLFLVFRSVVAPLIPLLTVGITYLASQSIVAFLVKYLGFPVSTYTQIFMVCIMFGIGTDYCILLMSRFKEEFGAKGNAPDAIVTTYKTAGKTVIYSAIAVLVAFVSLYFVQFDLYRSAVAVGVGIVVLLLGLYTIVPFFMVLLGRYLFWPLSKNIEHKENKLWGFAGSFAFARPLIALLIVAIITIPPIILYTGQENFNSLDEISDKYPSKKGFEIVSDRFGAGKVAPTQIFLENDDNMKTGEYIALIEKISSDLAGLKNVDMVMSASRPAGERLKDIYVNNQASGVHQGVNKANDGIGQVQKGLNSASQQLDKSTPQLNQAVSGIDGLQNGTDQTKNGINNLQKAFTQISTGIKQGAAGASDLKDGVKKARAELTKLRSGEKAIQSGYRQVQQNLTKVANGLNQIGGSNQPAIDTSALENQMKKVAASYQALAKEHPELATDSSFVQLGKNIQGLNGATSQFQQNLQKQMSTMKTQLQQLNQNISSLSSAMKQLNEQSTQIANGLDSFDSGLAQLEQGLNQLETGLNQTAAGQDQAISKMPQITAALDRISTGQNELSKGFSSMGSQIGQLTSGLKDGASGLGQVKTGLNSANSLISDWSKEPYANSGIYVPDQLMQNKNYQKALEQYISNDGKLATINVVLKENPYSNQAMKAMDQINDRLDASLKGTKLENAHIGIGGMTSMNHDTKQMSSADYHLVLIVVLASVFVTLVLLLRSIIMPIYLIASLVLTYFTALGFTEIIFVRMLGQNGITWAAPFFGFVVLVALGIDYSIFLMNRFNEYVGMPIKERMILTMKNMGGVIFSAVIILGGTFAAMMPAGVLSLLIIATIVLIGLVLYALVILPLFVPVMVKLFGRGNWWPFTWRRGDR
ncbi:MMPL family transporter [Listeria sp. PSOL-1]|uniref:MMPL family transporter n=1 Tax=Listeria sp. PSOL-1 TaxID=1844999 RepID=UPI0013D845A6|nr:MMPL family transporter [Listeria sp. PSOL-1]